MDDIYFTDKKGRRNGKEKKPDSDRFTQSDYKDIENNPALKKRSQQPKTAPKKKDFKVQISDDDFNRVTQPDRTPKGRKQSDIPSPPQSRTPSGERVKNDVPLNRTPAQKPQRPPDPPSRQPQRPPVAPVKKKKKKIGGKLAVALFLVIFTLIIGLFGYGYSILGQINYDDSIVGNTYIDEGELMSSSSVKNILIIGSDARDYDGTVGQRSDSMILFSIDKKNKEIKLTSFLRDSYVYIPDADYKDKLNASFSYGGPQLTMDTLEYNFGVDIDNYVIVDFDFFKQFINLLGGVPVEVTEYEAEYMVNELKYIYITPGVNNMNGNAALMYCRMRYLDNDFERTGRQRKVIKAVISKVAKTNPVELVEIVKQLVSSIRTDIPQSELLSLGTGAALSFLRYDIVQQQIPAEGTWWNDTIDGSDVLSIDVDINSAILKKFVYEKYDADALAALAEEAEQDYYDDDYYYYEDYYDDYYY